MTHLFHSQVTLGQVGTMSTTTSQETGGVGTGGRVTTVGGGVPGVGGGVPGVGGGVPGVGGGLCTTVTKHSSSSSSHGDGIPVIGSVPFTMALAHYSASLHLSTVTTAN